MQNSILLQYYLFIFIIKQMTKTERLLCTEPKVEQKLFLGTKSFI